MVTVLGGYDETDASKGSALREVTTTASDTDNNKVLLDVSTPSHIVANNSSTTTLGAGATFTGTSKMTNGYGILYVNVFSDVASATDGLVIEQSTDGTNWDFTDTFTIPANTGKTFSIQPAGRFFRIKYTNGGVDQTEFRLQCVLKATGLDSSHRIQDNIIDDDDARLRLSVLKLRTAANTYVSGAATNNGNFKVSTEEYDASLNRDVALRISKGDQTGYMGVNKFGAAPSGIQTTATDIWDRADATPTQQIWLAPTAARIHTIASDSVNDTTGGTGANTVQIKYLADWDTAEAVETVTGNLNAGIAMTNAAVMIHRMKVVPQATSTTANVGTITATAATDGTVTAAILPGNGQTEMAIYGIPSTQTAYLTKWRCNIDKSSVTPATADFQLRVNPNPDVQTVSFLRKNDISLQSTGSNMFESEFNPYIKITGPAIIKVQAMASAADLDGESAFDLIVVNN